MLSYGGRNVPIFTNDDLEKVTKIGRKLKKWIVFPTRQINE